MATYRDAIEYLVANDEDYVDHDSDGKPLPSVCVSMVAALFKKSDADVIADVERGKAELEIGGNQLAFFKNETRKLGFKPLTLQKVMVNGYQDLYRASFKIGETTMTATLMKLDKGSMYIFHIYFMTGAHNDFINKREWEIISSEIEYKKMSEMLIAGIQRMKDKA